jgi:hypothetical protein
MRPERSAVTAAEVTGSHGPGLAVIRTTRLNGSSLVEEDFAKIAYGDREDGYHGSGRVV